MSRCPAADQEFRPLIVPPHRECGWPQKGDSVPPDNGFSVLDSSIATKDSALTWALSLAPLVRGGYLHVPESGGVTAATGGARRGGGRANQGRRRSVGSCRRDQSFPAVLVGLAPFARSGSLAAA